MVHFLACERNSNPHAASQVLNNFSGKKFKLVEPFFTISFFFLLSSANTQKGTAEKIFLTKEQQEFHPSNFFMCTLRRLQNN
jgi:hypothetical protein